MEIKQGVIEIQRDLNSLTTIKIDGNNGNITLGGNLTDGDIIITNRDGEITIGLNGESGNIILGNNGVRGSLIVRNEKGVITARINSGDDSIDQNDPGYNPPGGEIQLNNLFGETSIRLDGGQGDLYLGSSDLAGNISVGRPGTDNPQILVSGSSGHIMVKQGRWGGVSLLDIQGNRNIHIDGHEGDITLASNIIVGKPGTDNPQILVSGSSGQITVKQGRSGGISLLDIQGNRNIHIDGHEGDITFNNADFAEEFDIAQELEIDVEKGMVMTLNPDGKLFPSNTPYDKKVAGIVSGAGGVKPGIVMDRKQENSNRAPIAMVGKAMCWVDADYGEIEIGDLLTSSGTTGHAMKAANPMNGIGSIIGKALQPLKEGKGLILVLVNLQ